METEEFYTYNDLIYEIHDLKDQGDEISLEIVTFVLSNLFFNNKFLEDPEVSERLDVLVDTNNAIFTILETLMFIVEDAYNKKDNITLEKCSKNLSEIRDFYVSYESYLNLLKDYKLCIDDYNVNTFVSKIFSRTYNDCIKNMLVHYNLVLEEKLNKSIAKEEEMLLIRKDRQLVRLSRKYLKKLEK